MINILVVSEIKIYCEGLSQILSKVDSLRVVGSVNNSEDAKKFISGNLPDVVLLDMTMAGSCSLAQHISDLVANLKIIALAVPYDETNILQCAEVGITGYVPREASINELIDAVVGSAKGECYCPPKIAACILNKIQKVALSAKQRYLPSNKESFPASSLQLPMLTCLTKRERQIASLLSNGLSNKQIARDLSIEVSTVKNHVHNVLIKLEVKSRNQAMSLLQQASFHSMSRSMDLDIGLELSS